MGKLMSSRRAARELSQVVRNMVESLEGRVLLSGSHETQLLGAISSALQDNAGSTLSAFNSRLTDASELGQSLPLIGGGLSSFDPGAELNTVLNRVTSGYTTLSQLTSALEGAAGLADGVAVAGSRDLPDDVEIDLQFSLSANKTVPISASFGSAFTASGSIGLNTTLTENLTLGAYWDSNTSTPVFYINAPGTSIQVAASVTAASLNATAQLGFVSLHVTGASASFTPTFTFSLTAPSDPNVPAGFITASELTDGTTP